MHRMAYTLTRNPDAAADLVQEAYLLAFRAWASFERRDDLPAREGEHAASASMRAWLFRILHNAHFTAGRKLRRAPALAPSLDDAPADIPDDAPVWNLRDLDWQRVDARLKNAIDSLSDEHRAALLLWGVEGMKYREIAEITGVPLGTVMSRLHRARRTVADILLAATSSSDDDLAVRVRASSSDAALASDPD